jgi:wyosine [tRNA(Phe)-imidazoG37] synthetase (radical SAM superfamily)
MTSKEFVIWMKGIVAASNNYNVTPGTWDNIKETLEKIKDDESSVQIFPYTQIRGINYTETRSDKIKNND